MIYDGRGRQDGLVLAAVAIVLCVLTSSAANDRGAAIAPRRNDALADAVLRGTEARNKVFRSRLHAFKGIWTVERNEVALSVDPVKQQQWLRELRLERSRYRVELAVDGDKWRHTSRLLEGRTESGEGDGVSRVPHQVLICDGPTLTNCSSDRKEGPYFCRSQPRGTLATIWQMADARYSGLSDVMGGRSPLRHEGASPTVTEEVVDGRECYVLALEWTGPNGLAESRAIWVCPDYGFAVVRTEDESEMDPDALGFSRRRSVESYSDFRPCGEDLWLPWRYSVRGHMMRPNGTWEASSSVTAQAVNLQVNVAIPAAEFQPPRNQVQPCR